MRRTSWADLAIVLVLVGAGSYFALHESYNSLPRLQYAVPVPIAVLAFAEVVAARRVRAAVRHDPDAKPMTAIAIARCVALGKASSLVATGVLGAAVGLLAVVLPDSSTVRAQQHDAVVAALLAGASILLAGAGLLLERAGIDPGRDRR